MCAGHKVHIYMEYHSVCPLVGIGTLPTLLCQRVRGWGSPNSNDQLTRRTLPTPWLGMTVHWNCKKTGVVEEGCKEKEVEEDEYSFK